MNMNMVGQSLDQVHAAYKPGAPTDHPTPEKPISLRRKRSFLAELNSRVESYNLSYALAFFPPFQEEAVGGIGSHQASEGASMAKLRS